MDISLAPDSAITLPVPQGHTAVVYLFEGRGLFESNSGDDFQVVEGVQMVVFGDGDLLRIRSGPEAGARMMLMAGAPFNEPIFPYGPFVMNTREEIQQALHELRSGTFVKDSAI
jgi:redox-sensitive bicupin YhaK (pirin superfamily)